MKRSKSAGRCIKFNVPKKQLPLLNETSESKETSENEEGVKNSNNNEMFKINIQEVKEDVIGEDQEQSELNNDSLNNEVSNEEDINKPQISFSKNNFENEVQSNSNSVDNLLDEPQKKGSILKQNGSKNNIFKTDHNDQPIKEKINSKNSNKPKEPINWKKVGINAIVMVVTVGLTLGLMNSLSTFLSLIGNFVGVFEIFVFPFLIIIILNRTQNIVSRYHLVRHFSQLINRS
jgi:hypothetical protein